jgi:uncharacterized protein
MTTTVDKISEKESEPTAIKLAGVDVQLDHHGAMLVPDEKLLVVSDLHLEKGSAFAARGQLLPPYDSVVTLAVLTKLILRHRPARLVLLGDSFHDLGSFARMNEQVVRSMLTMAQMVETIWISGNHDPELPKELPGLRADSFSVGPLTFRHEPQLRAEPGEVAGHLHPVAKVALDKGKRRAKAFVTDGERLVMPAFGAYTGGLNVLDPAFDPLFRNQEVIAHVCGFARVYPVKRSRLQRDGISKKTKGP